MQGWANIDLNEKGFLQSNLIGLRLQNQKFDRIMSSDLIRANDTLKNILRHNNFYKKFHKIDDIEVDSETKFNDVYYDIKLRERNVGSIELLDWTYLDSIYTTLDIDRRKFKPKDGISQIDHLQLVRDFLFDMVSGYVRKNYKEYVLDKLLKKIDFIKNLKIKKFCDENNIEELKQIEDEQINQIENLNLNIISDITENKEVKNEKVKILDFENYINKEVLNEDMNENIINSSLSLINDMNFSVSLNNKIFYYKLNDLIKIRKLKKIFNTFERLIQVRKETIVLDPTELLSVKEIEKNEKFNQNFSFSNKKLNSEFEKKDIDKNELEKILFKQLEKEPINTDFNFDYSQTKLEKILVTSHSGVIKEMINVILRSKGLGLISKSVLHNCSLTVIRFYCPVCKGKCVLESPECSVEIDFLIEDDISHLNILS